MYGLLPRFASMREFHCLLYYLTRCYGGDPELDKGEAMAAIRREAGSSFDAEIEDVGFEDGAVTTAPEAEKNKYLIIYLILINQYSIILNLIN